MNDSLKAATVMEYPCNIHHRNETFLPFWEYIDRKVNQSEPDTFSDLYEYKIGFSFEIGKLVELTLTFVLLEMLSSSKFPCSLIKIKKNNSF